MLKIKLNRVYYVCLILFLFILFIPVKYKIAVYGPNYLGWFWALLTPIILTLYFWLLIRDARRKELKMKIIYRTLFLLLTIGVYVIYRVFIINHYDINTFT